MKHPLLICLLSSASLAAVATAALADPPARVGRVAYTEGDISFQPPQSEEWISATRNFPVAPGEAFWTGDDGRAELQIGSVDTRLDSQTELDVVDVDYGDMRLALPQGSADLRLWSNPRRPVIIATPAGDVRLDARGLYRVDVGAPAQDGAYPPVEVTVFEGAAEAPSPEGMAPVQAGQAALIYAGYDPQFQYAENAAIDDWGRDLEARTGWRPNDDSSAALTGYGDLYAAGDFATDPQYGQVWFPRDVPDDWAPYRYGHWAYVEPWGYTWIDDQPWGFAPFHYGRWAQIDGRWGWVPGRPTPEPVYAPALVAFFGGAGWRFGDSDAIGWAPLAPDEDYRPGYSVSEDYRRRLNEGAFRQGYHGDAGERPAESYRNARAATVVRTADFSGARPVRAAALAVTPNVIASAPVAPPQAHPAPTPWARTGLALRQGVSGPAGPPPPAAARPPASLAVVRHAVVAPPPAPGRPPVIAGARITPPAPQSTPGAGRPATAMIAPAQLRHPQPPSGQPTTPSRPAFTGAPVGAPARPGASDASQRAAEAQAAARAQADQARQAQMQQARDAAARAQADQARQAQAQAAARAQAEQAQARAAQAQAARAQADQARQAQMQQEQAREAQARAQADQARQAQAQAQAQAAARAQAEQARAREAQAQAAQAQAAQARAEQARQAQAQAAARAQAARAVAAKPQPSQEHKQNDRAQPPPQP